MSGKRGPLFVMLDETRQLGVAPMFGERISLQYHILIWCSEALESSHCTSELDPRWSNDLKTE
jgi:hypothetical protein